MVIVGAGLSGLVAAHELQAAGVQVAVLDKGRSPGGRLATRRIGSATLDHGAQFFTVRTSAFQHRVDDWIERGLVTVWSHGFGSTEAHPRLPQASALLADAGIDLDEQLMGTDYDRTIALLATLDHNSGLAAWPTWCPAAPPDQVPAH